jgi:NDP-sugar pyrophosphorylase family protein
MSEPLLPVVILAGGLATRLGEAARSQPKCLVEVGGEPFLFHQLRQLRGQGVRRVTLCVGHLGEQVVAAVGDGSAFGLEVSFSFDGPTLVGTAGAIKRALPLLPSAFVLYGDSYLRCDFAAVQAAFRASDALALMTVFRNETQWDTSNVEYRDGRILAYDKAHQTERMRHIDYGLGVLDRRALDVVPDGRPYDLAAVYQEMLRIGRLAALEVSERFYEIGSPAGLEETRNFLSGLARTGGPS